MLTALRRLLWRSDPLTDASRRSERDAFIRLLVRTDVTVLAALDGPGLDVATLTQESLLAEIQRAAEATATAEHWLPFVYVAHDEIRCVPFFSTPKHVEMFCGAYSRSHGRVWGWETVVMQGIGLLDLLPHCDTLVLNPGTPDEQHLSADDCEQLLSWVSNPALQPTPQSRRG